MPEECKNYSNGAILYLAVWTQYVSMPDRSDTRQWLIVHLHIASRGTNGDIGDH